MLMLPRAACKSRKDFLAEVSIQPFIGYLILLSLLRFTKIFLCSILERNLENSIALEISSKIVSSLI